MRKILVAGVTAFAIVSTSLAYGQQAGRGQERQRWQPSAEDMRAFGEARLAALKAGLELTPDQARNWPAFEQAARDLAKQRIERRMAMRNAGPSNDPVERLRQRASVMSETGAALKKLSDATEPLYKSLDGNQKRRFAVLNRLTSGPRGRFRGREHEGSPGWSGRREGRLEVPGEQRL
jgi:hypothetical protein